LPLSYRRSPVLTRLRLIPVFPFLVRKDSGEKTHDETHHPEGDNCPSHANDKDGDPECQVIHLHTPLFVSIT
jgi:hypothetical protein